MVRVNIPSSPDQPSPVCTFEAGEFDALLAKTGLAGDGVAAGTTVAADTEATYMYRIEAGVTVQAHHNSF